MLQVWFGKDLIPAHSNGAKKELENEPKKVIWWGTKTILGLQ